MAGKNERVVYTAITGNYNTLKPVPKNWIGTCSFVAFVDEATKTALNQSSPIGSKHGWELRDIPAHLTEKDPNRIAKSYKVLPQKYFPDSKYSLWMDASVTLLGEMNFNSLIDRYLASADLCVFRHPKRQCLFLESEECLEKKLDEAKVIQSQMHRYRAVNFPTNAGLVEATVLLRRHTPSIERFNEAWWLEIEKGSRRDQLSFDYVRWKQNLKVEYFPGRVKCDNGIFIKTPHERPSGRTVD